MSKLTIYPDGTLTLTEREERICPSPVGILVYKGTAWKPVSAENEGESWILRYPCGSCRIRAEQKDRYWKLTLDEVPEGTDAFLFGPYGTGASSFGEVLGAGWYGDGSVVCIQSLMPKVEEGNGVPIRENRTGLDLPVFSAAAAEQNGKIILQCFVKDRTQPEDAPNAFGFTDAEGGTVRMPVVPEEGPDARIGGAAVALLTADSAEDLLSVIGEMEKAEGLPHPVYRGQYAKTDSRVSSYYLILNGTMTEEERIEIVARRVMKRHKAAFLELAK